jgi:hypothetical protein
MWDDAELWAWLNRAADAYQADKTCLWARVHQCQHELDEAGYRTTSPPEHEADDGGPVAAEPKVHFGRGQTSIDWRQRMVAIPT